MTHSNSHGIPQALQRLINYPAGTWIAVGERKFYRLSLGSFWREDQPEVDHHPSRSSLFIRNIEVISNERHRIIKRI